MEIPAFLQPRLEAVAREFRRLSDIGTRPGQSAAERRRIALTNQCAMLAAGTFGAYAVLSALLHLGLGHAVPWPIVAVNSFGVVAALGVFRLNAAGFALAARYFLILATASSNLASAYLVGAYPVFLYFYFPLVITPWFLFENPHRFHRTLLGAYCFGCFALIRWGLPARGAYPLPFSGWALGVFEAGTLWFISFILAMLVLFFSHETTRAEAVAADALARSEELLLNILPVSISARLKKTGRSLADGHEAVTVLFADLVGFTELSAHLPPDEVVRMLNEIFSRFDDLTARFGLEKIKTIGDAYMVAGGLPEPRADHVEAVAGMALAMQQSIAELNRQHGRKLELRIGLHTGPVVAGVIGKRKFIYDLWGDTVNTASRMESSGVPGAIQVTREVRDRLDGRFRTEPRGTIAVKGKGQMETFFLRGEG